MVIVKVYNYVPLYFNKFGEIIQDWDSYGIKNHHSIKYKKVIVDTIYSSDRKSALERVDSLYSDYELEIEDLNN